jgi:hypothetical protein
MAVWKEKRKRGERDRGETAPSYVRTLAAIAKLRSDGLSFCAVMKCSWTRLSVSRSVGPSVFVMTYSQLRTYNYPNPLHA